MRAGYAAATSATLTCVNGGDAIPYLRKPAARPPTMGTMNSPLFEPRRVAASAPLRWIRESVALIARAPLGFGLVLVAATVVDRFLFPALAAIATPAQLALIG